MMTSMIQVKRFIRSSSDEESDGMLEFIMPDDIPIPDETPALMTGKEQAPAMSLPTTTDPAVVTEGWNSVGTWRKDPLEYDVQYIKYFGDQVYQISFVTTTIAVGEQSVRDMLGEFVVAYFVAYPGTKLDAWVAIRIGLPDMMNELFLRRKPTTGNIVRYTDSAVLSSIKYPLSPAVRMSTVSYSLLSSAARVNSTMLSSLSPLVN